MVRTLAMVFLVGVLAVVVDISFLCAERAQKYLRTHTENQVALAVDDWEKSMYFAAALGLCAVGWLAGTCISPARRVARPAARAVRVSMGGVAVGSFLGVGLSVWFWASGESDADDRFLWEARWLLGAVFGAFFGWPLGAGLGVVMYLQPPGRRGSGL